MSDISDILEIHEFFVEGGSEKKSHVLLHISEPSSADEKRKGYFFALTEVERGSTEQIKEIQRMIDEAEVDYFTAHAASAQDAFEQAVREANRRGHHILAGVGKVHCFLGVLSGTTLLVATHGAPSVGLLYRRDEAMEYNPIGDNSADAEDGLFSSVLSGTMKSGDVVAIATSRVRDYFLPDRMKKLFSGRSVKDGAEHIKKVLGSLRDGFSYGGILLHILPREAAPKTGPRPKYLTTDAAPLPETTAEASEETNYRPRRRNAESLSGTMIVALGRALVSGTRGFVRWITRAGRAVGRATIFFIILATNKGGQRRTVLAEAQRKAAMQKERFTRLPLASKLLLFAAIIFACIFAVSMVYFRYEKTREAQVAAYRASIQSIRDKKDAAEASMIYGDDVKALALVTEGNALLADTPRRTNEEKETAKILTGDFDRLLMKLRKLHEVSSERWVALADADANARATRLARIDNTLLAYGPEDAHFYAVEMESREISAKSREPIPPLGAATTPKEQDAVVFAAGEAGIAAYQKDSGGLATKDIAFPEDGVRIMDLFVYNQRLFTLSPATNQIYRHAKTQTGYDRGAPWIKTEGVLLADATALAIDGDVFVLTANGIRKFAKGEEQAFAISGLDPALQNPAAIWTYNDVNLLYILEPTNKRLVVLQKSGKLVTQYTDAAWQNPTGMVVDEEKKTAYILDSNIVYRVALE